MSQSNTDSQNTTKTDIKVGGNIAPVTTGVGGDGIAATNSNFAYNVGGPETIQQAIELVRKVSEDNLVASKALVNGTLASGDATNKSILENNQNVISSLNQLLSKDKTSSSEDLLKKYMLAGLGGLALLAVMLWVSRK